MGDTGCNRDNQWAGAMFVNGRSKKRRMSERLATTAEEGGCEREEVRLDTPDMETEREKHIMEANEEEERRRELRRMQKAREAKTETKPEYEDI